MPGLNCAPGPIDQPDSAGHIAPRPALRNREPARYRSAPNPPTEAPAASPERASPEPGSINLKPDEAALEEAEERRAKPSCDGGSEDCGTTASELYTRLDRGSIAFQVLAVK